MNIRVRSLNLATSAFCVALSIVLGKVLSFTFGAFRISFENLPILVAGILLGPYYGALTGCVSDLLGCALVGYAINPIITLGAISIGFVSGMVHRCVYSPRKLPLAVYSAHFVGSIIIKTLGLRLYYNYPWGVLMYRLPLYVVIATIEYLFINALLQHLPKRPSV